MRLVTKATKRWAALILEHGVQTVVEGAMTRKGPFRGAMRFLDTLERAEVIQPWLFAVPHPRDETEEIFEVKSIPEDYVPADERDTGFDQPHLYIAGPNWDAFVAEAKRAGAHA